MSTTPGGMQSMPVHLTGFSDYWLIKLTEMPLQIPISAFASTDTVFCEKQCIDFYDLSQNNPLTWQWHFQGGVPDTSTLKNPSGICYNMYGNFNVTLITCNTAGCDTLTLTNFISEYQNPVDSIWLSNDTLYSLPALFYQWYEAGTGLLNGAVDSIYVISQPGSYYCVVTNSAGCIGSSNIVNVNGFSNANPGESDKLILFPNPNNGQFVLMNNNGSEILSISVYDFTGRKIYCESASAYRNRGNINLDLTSGIYQLSIETTHGLIFRAFNVQH